MLEERAELLSAADSAVLRAASDRLRRAAAADELDAVSRVLVADRDAVLCASLQGAGPRFSLRLLHRAQPAWAVN